MEPSKTKHSMYLYTGDYDRLMILYGPGVVAKVIRKLIRKHILEVETEQKDQRQLELDFGEMK